MGARRPKKGSLSCYHYCGGNISLKRESTRRERERGRERERERDKRPLGDPVGKDRMWRENPGE